MTIPTKSGRKFNPRDLITSDPEVMSGRHVFRGTRVPIETLFENLADGMSIDEILRDFPTLDRNDVVRLLEMTPTILIRERRSRARSRMKKPKNLL